MVTFKKKNFTIPEGHYTGPKDIDKIPGAVETITKGVLGGAGIGAIAGGVLKDTTMLEGALTGAKYGTLGGIVAKLFLNYIHKPMSTIKYQEVDKSIRRQFGVFQMAGVTVGDTLDKRAKIDDKFSFNDRDVSSYKLNFAVHNNQVTMYTFGMTKEELDLTSKTLDYYCKKYFSMEYSAKIINQKVNSYSVDITFTNYYALCNFIMELSQVLNTKINLLDNNVIIAPRLQEAAEEEKEFSLTRYDVIKFLGNSLPKALGSALNGGKKGLASAALGCIIDFFTKAGKDEVQKACGVGMMRGDYDNKFLVATLKKLHYVEGFHYTTGDNNSELQMSLISGVLCISCLKEKCSDLDEGVWKSLKTIINRIDGGRVVTYTYALKDTKEFELILNKIMNTNLNPNIFDKTIKFKGKSFSNVEVIDKVKERLDQNGIVDYEISDRVPTDVISLNANLNAIKIYIPRDLEYSQYEIDDFIRTQAKFVRTNTSLERNIFVMKLNGTLTQAQYIKLIKWIIEDQGFCTILSI